MTTTTHAPTRPMATQARGVKKRAVRGRGAQGHGLEVAVQIELHVRVLRSGCRHWLGVAV